MMKNLEIAAGIIMCGGKVLLGKRLPSKAQGGLWEFPGGKLEAGETLEECLKREMKEEMNLQIKIERFLMQSMYAYEFAQVRLNVFLASCTQTKIDVLTAHETYAWVLPKMLETYKLAPADIPVAKAFMLFLAKN